MELLHEELLDRLYYDIKSNQIKQNYLFTGEEGIGKKTLAKRFAKALLCNNPANGPCNVCKNCKMFEAGTDVDFISVKETNENILIETMRNITSEVKMRPANSNRKVVFIPSCERMTEQAQNSLLKTFEDPPLYATIIMTTIDKNLLLQTIRSRVFEYKLKRQNENKIMNILGIDDDFCIHYGGGNIGKTKKCLEEEFKINKQYAIDILKNVLDKNVVSSREVVKSIKDDDLNEIMITIMELLRDMSAIMMGAKRIIHTDVLDDIVEILEKSSYDSVIERFKKTQKAIEALNNYTNKKIILESYLL